MTVGVVQWRKHSRFDCVDPVSKIMIPTRERERERLVSLYLNPENRGCRRKQRRKRERRTRRGEMDRGRDRLTRFG